jgi:tetratricopeptide (TPR) repeat protein
MDGEALAKVKAAYDAVAPRYAEQFLHEYEQMPDVTAGSDPEFKAPVIASITLGRGFPESALEVLAPLKPYERGWRFNFVPTYVRGVALVRLKRYGEAITEFDRIINQRGAVPDTFVYPLAVLQLARAKAASGDGTGARAAYERFLAMWKDADPDLPVLAQAREELARLR